MAKTIKAKFSHGVIEPLEKLEYHEGEELTVTIVEMVFRPGNVHQEQGWTDIAMSGFVSDWDNDQDAVYDDWEKSYHVRKG